MAQPTLRIGSAHAAFDAARRLQTPSEVEQFEAMRAQSAAVRAFLQTPEWAALRTRIMGDGRPPLDRPESLEDLVRLFLWSADGAFSETLPTDGERRVYLHVAAEIEAFARTAARVAPVSPAPAPQPLAVASSNAGAPGGLQFGEAFLAVQAGQHISRRGWPAGSFVTMQAGYPQGIGVNTNTAQATGLAPGTVAVFGPYLMRCRGGLPPAFVPWTPDQDDLFARDWCVWARPGA